MSSSTASLDSKGRLILKFGDEKRSASAPDQEQIAKETVDPQAPSAMYEFEMDPDSCDVNRAYKEPNPVRTFPQQVN